MWAAWEERGGIARDAAALAAELRRRGAEVEGVPVPFGDRSPARTGEALRLLNAADLIHIQHEYRFFGGVAPRASTLPLYLPHLKRPRVVTAHTVATAAELLGLPQEERPRQRVAKQLLSISPSYRRDVERMPFEGAAAVIVHTPAAREQMLARRLPPERIHVVPAGIPAPEGEEAPPEEIERLRDRLGLGGFRVVGLFAWEVVGADVALDALRSLPPAVRLLIAGDPPLPDQEGRLEALRASVREKGLEGRVTLCQEGETGVLMTLSDVVLIPSAAADGGHSIRAALGYGRPVLAPERAGLTGIYAEEEAVELFHAGDSAALAERIGFLLASASARKRLSERACEVAARHTWSAAAEATLAIYRRVLAQGGR